MLLKAIIPGILCGLCIGIGITTLNPIALAVGIIGFILHYKYLGKCKKGK